MIYTLQCWCPVAGIFYIPLHRVLSVATQPTNQRHIKGILVFTDISLPSKSCSVLTSTTGTPRSFTTLPWFETKQTYWGMYVRFRLPKFTRYSFYGEWFLENSECFSNNLSILLLNNIISKYMEEKDVLCSYNKKQQKQKM